MLTLVADVLRTQPLRATRMAFGHNSITYDVALPDRDVIVRTNDRADVFAGTERNLTVLHGLGLPVSQVLASDLKQTQTPFAYMILEKIPGRDLRYELGSMNQAQMTRLAEQVVAFQRTVAGLPEGSGYGFVSVGEKGPYSFWWELICHEQIGNRTGRFDDELAYREARIIQEFKHLARYFLDVPPTCFLDDLTVKNVIVESGELRGLVDFDCVCYGDPLYWIALTAVGVVSDVGTAGLFYIEELMRLWALTDVQRRVLALYSASMCAWFVRRFTAQETTDWRQRMLTAMERWMNEV